MHSTPFTATVIQPPDGLRIEDAGLTLLWFDAATGATPTAHARRCWRACKSVLLANLGMECA